jgi:hypothetical protein
MVEHKIIFLCCGGIAFNARPNIAKPTVNPFYQFGINEYSYDGMSTNSWWLCYVLAIAEYTIIRMMSELGRLMGIIERGEWNCIGKRFDGFVNRSKGKIKEERLNNLKKLVCTRLTYIGKFFRGINIDENPMYYISIIIGLVDCYR